MSFELDGAYQAPQGHEDTDEQDDDAEASAEAGFYVVSTQKLLVLQVLSLGLYSAYWFYKHWAVLRSRHGHRVRPLVRAFFPVFFTHQLFRAFDRTARQRGYAPTWQAGSQASRFVVMAIVAGLMTRAGGVEGQVVALLIYLCLAIPMGAAQRVANLASADRNGQSSTLEPGAVLIALLFGGLRLAWQFGYLALTTAFY